MGLIDKAKNAAQKLTGEAKETVGEHTGDDELRAEGAKDKAAGSLKNAGENVKDAFKE
ncbi:MAG: CsbD family protein [Nocardioides sp.]|uniref:CsbD family protein n=1 Tax=Nocardioides sp. TaxID=35761 RepID=UPI0039E2412C